jgi:hypothetical protein
MKKYTFLLIILSLATLLEPAMAQSRRPRYKRNIPIWYRSRFYTTVGGGIGSANYFGDITPAPSFASTDIKFTRSSLTGFVTHKFTPRITGRAALAWHRLKGDDFVSANPSKDQAIGRYIRNLHFRNDVIELSGVAMFDFIENNSPFFKRPTWSPYGFIGLGVIYSNPMARTPVEEGAKWVSLRPLHTEGRSYSPVQVVIPAGVGVRYKLSQRIDLGFEVGYRFTFTDYLDDVSGKYVDPSKLGGAGSLAARMANRTLEPTAADAGKSREQGLRNIAVSNYGCTSCDQASYDPFNSAASVLGKPKEGTIRGAGKGNDWYLVTNFHISYILVNVVQRPRFR